MHDAVCAVLHRRGIDLAVGDVQLSVAGHDRDVLDGKRQIGPGADKADPVSFFHQFDQRLHVLGHLLIVHERGREEEFVKIVVTHTGLLRVRQRGPVQIDPAPLVDDFIAQGSAGVAVIGQRAGVDRGKLRVVFVDADVDVRRHVVPVFIFPFELRVDGGLRFFRVLGVDKAEEQAADLVVRHFYERHRADGVRPP